MMMIIIIMSTVMMVMMMMIIDHHDHDDAVSMMMMMRMIDTRRRRGTQKLDGKEQHARERGRIFRLKPSVRMLVVVDEAAHDHSQDRASSTIVCACVV